MPVFIIPFYYIFYHKFYQDLIKIYKTIDVIRKAIAANVVNLESIASIVLPLFLPKKVSAPPVILPVSPALLPDWSKTITIIANAKNIWNMYAIIFSASKHITLSS